MRKNDRKIMKNSELLPGNMRGFENTFPCTIVLACVAGSVIRRVRRRELCSGGNFYAFKNPGRALWAGIGGGSF
jgi:hypothetical protein